MIECVDLRGRRVNPTPVGPGYPRAPARRTRSKQTSPNRVLGPRQSTSRRDPQESADSPPVPIPILLPGSCRLRIALLLAAPVSLMGSTAAALDSAVPLGTPSPKAYLAGKQAAIAAAKEAGFDPATFTEIPVQWGEQVSPPLATSTACIASPADALSASYPPTARPLSPPNLAAAHWAHPPHRRTQTTTSITPPSSGISKLDEGGTRLRWRREFRGARRTTWRTGERAKGW